MYLLEDLVQDKYRCVIQDHQGHGVSNDLVNPFWTMIPWLL